MSLPKVAHAAETFNSQVRILLKVLDRLYPGDPEVGNLRRRAGLAMAAEPLALLKAGGPHLVRHRAQIAEAAKSGDDTFFLTSAFEGDLKKAAGAAGEGAADGSTERLVGKIKARWPGLDETQKKGCRAAVCRMLDAYLDYCEAAAP
jgi:hypothetical protein